MIIFMLVSISATAQDTTIAITDSACAQRDLPDLIREWRHKPPSKKNKTGSLLLVPVVASNPATGFQFGAAGQYAFKDEGPNSLYSTVVGNATYTTKNQFMLQIKNNIYLNNNRIFLTGDWRLFFFSQATYGLSTRAPESGILKYQYNINGAETNDDSLVQPMKFDHVRFHQSASFLIKDRFMAGVGYQYDRFTNIKDLRLDTSRPFYTSHYTYSKFYGYNPEKYTVSGVTVNLLYDSRDNLVNAYKGYFAMATLKLTPEFLGNARGGNTISLEYRSFHGLSTTNPRHLLAFWFMGNFSEASGELPYMALPALGYDQRGRAGRGYTQGRFRGPSMVYGETEYRFPISPCGGVLGGVLFANFTTANSPENKVGLFDYVAPGYGFGFRLMIDKKSRTNLQVDFGFGQKSGGVYFGASETF